MVIATDTNIGNELLERVNTMLHGGKSVNEACGELLTDWRKNEDIERFLDKYGVEAISEVWRKLNRNNRKRELKPSEDSSGRTALLSTDAARAEGLWPIGNNKYLPLKELTGLYCAKLVIEYGNLAESNGRKAVFFQALADGLEPEQTVGEKYTEETTQEMWETCMASEFNYDIQD